MSNVTRKIKVEGLNIKTTKKDGTPFQNGSAKVGIKTIGAANTEKAGQDVWLNGWLTQPEAYSIKQGQELEVEVWNDEQWGLQFKVISGIEVQTKSWDEARILKIEEAIRNIQAGKSTDLQPAVLPPPPNETEIKIEDIPF